MTGPSTDDLMRGWQALPTSGRLRRVFALTAACAVVSFALAAHAPTCSGALNPIEGV